MRSIVGASLVCCAALLAATGLHAAETAVLQAVADATIYFDGETQANGAGQYVFAGTNSFVSPRRALIRFDVASAVPAGATVLATDLTLNLSRAKSGPHIVSLHRLGASWNEGRADPQGEEGGGSTAQPGDATWIHRELPSLLWLVPGGDFAPAASDDLLVEGPCLPENGQTAACGKYRWGSTPAMVADVQSWLDDPAQNHGWILVGQEGSTFSAKRFDSRDHPTPANRPILRVVYDAPVAAGAVPDGGSVPGTPLRLEKPGTTDLVLTWSPSCVAGDSDYEIYIGDIGDFDSHVPYTCTTGGATSATLPLDPAFQYYLIVPRNDEVEGSYGVDSSGNPRPSLPATHCLPRSEIDCP